MSKVQELLMTTMKLQAKPQVKSERDLLVQGLPIYNSAEGSSTRCQPDKPHQITL